MQKINSKTALTGCLSLLLILASACANYKFMRAFKPLLTRDLSINSQYREFEESLPNDKHWQENMSTLKGMADEKIGILQKLKALTPTEEYESLFTTLIEDLNHSISYLNIEIASFHKKTEYGLWLANSIYEGLDKATPQTKKELLKAKEEALRLQSEMSAIADKCNASQERLARLLKEEKLSRVYQPLKYAKFHKEYVDYKLK